MGMPPAPSHRAAYPGEPCAWLYCHCLEILNHFRTKSLTLSFCTGLSNLCSQFKEQASKMHWLMPDRGSRGTVNSTLSPREWVGDAKQRSRGKEREGTTSTDPEIRKFRCFREHCRMWGVVIHHEAKRELGPRKVKIILMKNKTGVSAIGHEDFL